jgi:hypothetical protein
LIKKEEINARHRAANGLPARSDIIERTC